MIALATRILAEVLDIDVGNARRALNRLAQRARTKCERTRTYSRRSTQMTTHPILPPPRYGYSRPP